VRAKERAEILAAGRRMYEAGLVTGSLGSMGIRLSSGEIVITTKGSRLGFLSEEDLLVMNGSFPANQASGKLPDEDAGILYQVLKNQPDAGAVIRVHSPYSTVLAHRGRKHIEKAEPLLAHLGGVAFVPYYRPGTAGLAGAVADAMRGNCVAIIERQGCVVRGIDLSDAVDRAEALEASAKVIYLLSSNNGVR